MLPQKSTATRVIRLPVEDPRLVGTNTLGYTTPDGRVRLQPGLSRAEQIHVLRHESVHAALSPKGSGAISRLRQNLGQFSYDNSQLLRFTEEAIAEGYASRSIVQGLRHPLNNPYGITRSGLIIETTAYGTIVIGGVYLGHELGESLFDEWGAMP